MVVLGDKRMTIKELYSMALEMGAENYTVMLDHETKQIIFEEV